MATKRLTPKLTTPPPSPVGPFRAPPTAAGQRAVADLHERFTAGALQILVGAGISVASGFPTWDVLTHRLVRDRLQTLRGTGDRSEAALSKTVAEHIASLGRDGAVDFVRKDCGNDGVFHLAVARSLYSGLLDDGKLEESAVRSTQRQLAAMAWKSVSLAARGKPARPLLFTTNYDPLLELALAAQASIGGQNLNWREFRRPPGSWYDPKESRVPTVQHIHGWIDPDGRVGGHVVLTEAQYLDLQLSRREAEAVMRSLFMGPRSTLIVGMSLLDPNIRRFLHMRRRQNVTTEDEQRVVVVLRRQGDDGLDAHLREYWEAWKVTPLLIDEYDDLTRLLRDVAWGPTADLPWLTVVDTWMKHLGVPGVVFTDRWQRQAHEALKVLRKYIERYFALPWEENLEISLFLPGVASLPRAISKVATTRAVRSGTAASLHAANRSLRIELGKEEGVAGVAFVGAAPIDVLDNGEGINFRFDDDKVRRWDVEDSWRDWRSIIAVPVLDLKQWLPYAVVTISSNQAQPFWRRIEGGHDIAWLKELIRRAAKVLVAERDSLPEPADDRSEHSPPATVPFSDGSNPTLTGRD